MKSDLMTVIFKKGDFIEFKVIEKDNLYYKKNKTPYEECLTIEKTVFVITYVLSFFPDGLKDDYVILGIKRLSL